MSDQYIERLPYRKTDTEMMLEHERTIQSLQSQLSAEKAKREELERALEWLSVKTPRHRGIVKEGKYLCGEFSITEEGYHGVFVVLSIGGTPLEAILLAMAKERGEG